MNSSYLLFISCLTALYASFINFDLSSDRARSASDLPDCISGWYASICFLYAAETSVAVAPRLMPSTEYLELIRSGKKVRYALNDINNAAGSMIV
jgi:hypothetical protein